MAKIDTGLASLILVAKHYKITADMRQLERAYVLEEGSVDTNTLVRAGRDLKLKVRSYSGLTFDEMKKLPCPAILTMKNGRYIVLHG
ncbi:MAG: type I secretion system permease/ATPase, partial [Selenomonadaceae bacterium]|nr:type I secretion system permease/ATPase [Selenomonadaceae bacterium]